MATSAAHASISASASAVTDTASTSAKVSSANTAPRPACAAGKSVPCQAGQRSARGEVRKACCTSCTKWEVR